MAQRLDGLGGEEVTPQRALEHLVHVLAVADIGVVVRAGEHQHLLRHPGQPPVRVDHLCGRLPRGQGGGDLTQRSLGSPHGTGAYGPPNG